MIKRPATSAPSDLSKLISKIPILMLPNGTKISYGVTINIAGGSLSNFVVPPPANNLSS
jgi:hypothetical protein